MRSSRTDTGAALEEASAVLMAVVASLVAVEGASAEGPSKHTLRLRSRPCFYPGWALTS